MADPVSLASSVVALSTFAIQSSKALYDVFESFKNKVRTVRELKQELEALENVLWSLNQTPDDPDIDLSALKEPLLRCGEACRGFAKTIEKSTARSNIDKTSFRDWFMLSYRGKDISHFRNLIATYKSTIAIALADVNIRYANVTAKVLREYKEMIDETTSDLRELLDQAPRGREDSSLQEVLPAQTDTDDGDQAAIEEERASIQQCLNVCMQVSAHIDQVRAENFAEVSTSSGGNQATVMNTRPSHAQLITSEKLKDCNTGIRYTVSELQLRLQDANHRLSKLLHQSGQGHVPDEVTVQEAAEEAQSIQRCLSICEDAKEDVVRERVNVVEDIRSTDDSHQVVVATLGDLISAKHVITGARSKQWIGQMSDASLQQLSKDNRSTAVGSTEESASTKSSDANPQDRTANGRVVIRPQFEGQGRKLGQDSRKASH